MNTFEQLSTEFQKNGICIFEKSFRSNAKGLCKGNIIAINQNIETSVEKSCVLAEELGHYYTTTGNILDQTKTENRKQELSARLWAYNKMIGLDGLIDAYEHGCCSQYEVAEYLQVTEEFLQDAVQRYASIYGEFACVDNYIVYFIPTLGIMKLTI